MSNLPLTGKRVYIGGPIEHSTSGANWRLEPKHRLISEFQINVFDPHEDPKQQWSPLLNEAREKKDYDLMHKIAKSFVRKDLAMVDRADFLISYLPYKVPTTGTHHEIINSANAKKPTLLVTDADDIAYIPLWYYGFIPKEFMFSKWETLFEYLHEVNAGKYMSNNKWSFVYGLI